MVFKFFEKTSKGQKLGSSLLYELNLGLYTQNPYKKKLCYLKSRKANEKYLTLLI